MTDLKQALGAFLESDEPVVTTIPTPIAVPEVVNVTEQVDIDTVKDNKTAKGVIVTVIADMKRIGMVAKNLHYFSRGEAFYGMHLLADLVSEIENMTDELYETYFLGQQADEPEDQPMMEEIFRKALDITVLCPRNNNYWIGGLAGICFKTMGDVEIAKKLAGLKAGVQAVLDNISQKCLTAYGLLKKTEE